MSDLPRISGGWRCLISDPPWSFSDRNTRGAAERHYPTMAVEEIAALPVESIMAPDALAAIWCPDTHLTEALLVAHKWGFEYRHLFVWAKIGKTGKIQIGLGHRMRKAHEIALVCTRGEPEILDHGVPSLCLAPRGRHSVKPEALHLALERLVAGPRLEMFARSTRAGWTAWGNEVGPKEE